MNAVITKIKQSIRSTQKQSTPISLRTISGEMTYTLAKKAGRLVSLSEEPALRVWKYWRLIENAFPYDIAFKVHHLLIPIRVIAKGQLNIAEKEELEIILDLLSDEYDCYLENFVSKQSIKNHYHLHLLTYKDDRTDMSLY